MPWGDLLVSSNTLYGTTCNGDTVYRLSTDGTGFTNLYSFTAESGPYPYTNSDGAFPTCRLAVSANTLFGTTSAGGALGHGTVFTVNTDGIGFKTLHAFNGGDGDGPAEGLVLSGNILYGTAAGGSLGCGTVFALNTDGSGFTNLYNFAGPGDGAYPYAGLILSGNKLYGTAYGGGSSSNGTVFALNTDGTGFATLHTFAAGSGSYPNIITSEGTTPYGGLILSGNTLYGTAQHGGNSSNGTVFALNTDGTGFTTLHTFTATTDWTNRDGASPSASLVLSGNTLYGTTYGGGNSGGGTVFSIALPPPQLTVAVSQANLVLTWPTNVPGLVLQSTTNLGSSAVWSTNSQLPVVINGQNVVTNAISDTQRFFRLSQ